MAESLTSKRNKGFIDMATLGGTRQSSDIEKTSIWTSKNHSTSGVTTRFRSGSITETHMHGSGMGTAKHTDRKGTVTSLLKSEMNASTKAFVRGRHGK